MKKSLIFQKKRAQVTLFVILAIAIIAAIAFGSYYLNIKSKSNVKYFSPIQDYFSSCVKEKAENAVLALGLGAGYLENPTKEQGSGYMPFSSQLNFLDTEIPYWAYIDKNGDLKKQVPSISSMQLQLENFLDFEIKKCDFSDFETQGFSFVFPDKAKTGVSIKDESIEIILNYPIEISKEENKAKLSEQKITLDSKLGKMYKTAKKIYDAEFSVKFLENYSLDVLTLYAPTTDVEISCTPKIWQKSEITKNIKDALEGNIAAIKFQGQSYKLTKPENKYFVVPVSVNEDINLLYSQSWPTKFEIYSENKEDSEKEVIISNPIGIQQGLSAMGFCYVPYHFVYDLAYPVMIQIFDSKEMFQFPVIVSIEKNSATKPEIEEVQGVEEQICNNKNTEIKVTTTDAEENPVEANIYFKCLNEQCSLGQTKIQGNKAVLDTNSPQCVGSYLIATPVSKNYAETKVQEDIIDSKEVNIIFEKLYELQVEPDISKSVLAPTDFAIISFTSSDYSISLAYPQEKSVKLKTGYYNVSIQVYSKGNIEVSGYTDKQCFNVPASGLAGIFGFEEEKCIDINLPSQTVDQVISGAGRTSIFVTKDDLKEAKKIRISASYIQLPKNVDDLQEIYTTIDENPAEVTIE